MMGIELAIVSDARLGRAPSWLGLAVAWVVLTPVAALAAPAVDANLTAVTAVPGTDADQAADDAGASSVQAVRPPKPEAPAVDRTVLVADGEPMADIDKIIERLDRRAPVRAVAFSPDGSLIVSGSEDHMVRVWHLATGRLMRRLEGHSSAVTAVAFSPDGRTIASAANDRTARLWDVGTGRALRTLQGHVYHVYAVAFDPEGRWLATASWDRTIQLWDLKTGALLKKLRGHGDAIRSIDFSHDGRMLASGSDDRTIRLWDVHTGQVQKVLQGHAGAVSAVRFRPDGAWLFSGSTDQTVRMWRPSDATMLRKLDDCGGPVLGLADSPNGQLLAGACGSGGSVLWDVPTGAPLRRRGGQGVETRAIAFSQDGAMVASGSEDASIVVEDVATGRALATLSANVAHLEAVAFAPDGQDVATVSRDHRVLVWRDKDGHKVLARVLVGAQAGLRALGFSPDGKTIAASGADHALLIWDGEGEGPTRRLTKHEGAINALTFTPDGRGIVSAGEDASVRVWDLRKDAEGLVLQGHRAPVRALAKSPDGKMLASASDDETVRLWDAATGRGLGVLKSHRAPVTSIAFSSDGKYLITGSQDRSIDVWLHAKGKLLKPLRKELPSGVVALAVHGTHVVSASSDGMLTLWDLAGSKPLQQISAHADISALASSPDGATVASASRDGVLRLWDSKTLARGWALAGSTRERWFACNHAQSCWRNEDGALLGRVDARGDFMPVSPSDSAHRTEIAVAVEGKGVAEGIRVVEGQTVSIPLRIENRGAHPAYWVNVARSLGHAGAGKASLMLIPPPTITVLAPGARVKVVCEVSALGEYENPTPHAETLRLSITSASAAPLSLQIPMRVETPHLGLRAMSLSAGAGEAVAVQLSEVVMAQLQPVILHSTLSLEGIDRPGLAPITVEQAFNGQDLTLVFPLPDGVHLQGKPRATLTVRKSTHPAHLWTFARIPVRVPAPLSLWALIAAALLGIVLVVRRTGVQAWARFLGRIGKRLARTLWALLRGLTRAFLALILLRSTLRSVRASVQRGVVAIIFFRLQPETQCSHLARQLGARWQPLAGGREPLFELHFGSEVPLDLERCLLALPSADALDAALAHLDASDEGEDGITVVLSELPRDTLVERLIVPRRLVVFSKAAMNRVLRAPRPALVFAQVVSAQLDRASLSLYRSAVGRGHRQPFHGRRSELRRLTDDARGNHLIIGPHGVGKTSLLDELDRRLRAQPNVLCHYLSLADGDLTSALADELGMPGQPSLEELLEQLGHSPEGKRVVVLCDDADAWATRDAAQGGPELAALASLDREARCSFVLAGFLGLLHAAWPAADRKPFGDIIRLECLDDEACAELVSEPMAALNAHYARAALVELISEESAGMPSLLVAICDQIVEGLAPEQRTIDRALVERACQSAAVARTITAWRPRFGLQEPQLATLDQTVMLAAVFKTRFTLAELQATLAGLGVRATPTEIEHSARRLVAACVFETWLGHFQFRVPLFQRVMREAALARVIAS